MRASAAEYRSLSLRGHELLRDGPLYDVSSVDLPGGGSGRTVADICALESSTAPSHIATLLYGLRYFLGPGIRLGSRTDAAGRLISGTPVGTRPTRLRNTARYSGWPLLGLVSISGRSSS